MTSVNGGIAPDCEAVLRAVWEYLDRVLGAVDMAEIDAHLAACAACRGHVVFEQRLLDQIRALRAPRAQSDALRARVIELLRRERLADPER